MIVVWFFVGFLVGVGAKFGLDEYVKYHERQEKTYLDMKDILVKFKAIELMKDKEKVKVEIL